MKFLNNQTANYDLTYSDVFLVPSLSDIKSRYDVDIKPNSNIGLTIPIVVANMSAVAGKRMSETITRRGGLVVLPQDIPTAVLKEMVQYIKSRHLIYDTPLTLGPDNTIAEAINIIHKRAHGVVVIVDQNSKPIGLFKEKDQDGFDRFTHLNEFLSDDLILLNDGLKAKDYFKILSDNHIKIAPVIDKSSKIVGILNLNSALRSEIYQPAVDKQNRLLVCSAIGINSNPQEKALELLALGVDVIVLDTAHGHQQKMLSAIKSVREIDPKIPIVAGNVVTSQAVIDLVKAGANIIKVGIGPGSMCTTRMMTAVGRPQLSAVLECAKTAKELGAQVWADGGVKHPRDVVLALAAGADSVMIGSWFAATNESAADVQMSSDNRLYKENYGMASNRAVKNRNSHESAYLKAKKEFFEEGISTSKLYLNPYKSGSEDILDEINAGLRSAMTYSGAHNLTEFQDQAIIGIQSSSGYEEGKPVSLSW